MALLEPVHSGAGGTDIPLIRSHAACVWRHRFIAGGENALVGYSHLSRIAFLHVHTGAWQDDGHSGCGASCQCWCRAAVPRNAAGCRLRS